MKDPVSCPAVTKKIIALSVAAAAVIAGLTTPANAATTPTRTFYTPKNRYGVQAVAVAYYGKAHAESICDRQLYFRVHLKGDKDRRYAYRVTASVSLSGDFWWPLKATLDQQRRPTAVWRPPFTAQCGASNMSSMLKDLHVKFPAPVRVRA
jgi:hypothetical protein